MSTDGALFDYFPFSPSQGKKFFSSLSLQLMKKNKDLPFFPWNRFFFFRERGGDRKPLFLFLFSLFFRREGTARSIFYFFLLRWALPKSLFPLCVPDPLPPAPFSFPVGTEAFSPLFPAVMARVSRSRFYTFFSLLFLVGIAGVPPFFFAIKSQSMVSLQHFSFSFRGYKHALPLPPPPDIRTARLRSPPPLRNRFSLFFPGKAVLISPFGRVKGKMTRPFFSRSLCVFISESRTFSSFTRRSSFSPFSPPEPN